MNIHTCCWLLLRGVRDVPLLAWTVCVQSARGPPVVCHWPHFTHRPSSPPLLWSHCPSRSVSNMSKRFLRFYCIGIVLSVSSLLVPSRYILWFAFLGHLASGTKLWTDIQWRSQLRPTKRQHLTGSVYQQPNGELNQIVHVRGGKNKTRLIHSEAHLERIYAVLDNLIVVRCEFVEFWIPHFALINVQQKGLNTA